MSTVLAPSPHVRSSVTVETAMYGVIIALLPGALVGAYYFGLNALKVMAVSILACLAFEALALKMRGKELSPLKDGSAILTGLLLAMNLPSNIPSWMVVVGALIAIGLLSLVGPIARWLPNELIGAVDTLARGGEFDEWGAVVVTLVVTVLLLVVAVRRLEHREV